MGGKKEEGRNSAETGPERWRLAGMTGVGKAMQFTWVPRAFVE